VLFPEKTQMIHPLKGNPVPNPEAPQFPKALPMEKPFCSQASPLPRLSPQMRVGNNTDFCPRTKAGLSQKGGLSTLPI
jgi:hypothetical protein